MSWPWSFSLFSKSRVKIFLDTENCEMGKPFAKKIFRELDRFDVGLVVVTEDFFVGKWPMTELIAFVEAQKNDPLERTRVLPLFYKLTPDEVRGHLNERTWEDAWEKMNNGTHPLKVEKCRQAVTWLCSDRGIPYASPKLDHTRAYIETICKELDKILCTDRSFASYLRAWARTPVKRGARAERVTGPIL